MTTATEQRVDWFRLLADLKRLGFSLRSLPEHVHIPYETMRDWANKGHEPRHSDGERLIAFWQTVMNRPRESVPMIDPHDFRA